MTMDATPMSYATPICCSFCRKKNLPHTEPRAPEPQAEA